MSNNGIPQLKMILLEESEVGKTSLIKRYLNVKFDRNGQNTMTMSYVAKTIEIDKKNIFKYIRYNWPIKISFNPFFF